jgi:hypothetical protein
MFPASRNDTPMSGNMRSTRSQRKKKAGFYAGLSFADDVDS